MLIFENLKTFAKTQPDKKCFINGSTQLTYKELASTVDNMAHRLAHLIKKGNRILIRSSDPARQLCYLLSISKLSAASVLVDPSIPEKMYKNLIKKSNAVFCIDDKFYLPGIALHNLPQNLPKVGSEDLFLGALSSGSTGNQKLIWRDHRSWASAFPEQSRIFGLGGSDTLFLCGSLIYTANLNSCLHILYEGGTVVMAANSFPQTWIKEIIHHNVSSIFMVPANYRTLLKVVKTPLSQIKSIVSAGAKMDIDTVKRLMASFPLAQIYEYYGASELGHVSYSRGEDLLKFPSSVGKAFPGVRFWTEDNFIWVESPYIAPAYKPKATVGDLGRVDEEGYLYLQGREHNAVNKGGVKIPVDYVEQILNQCPGVAESAVKGIDDGMRGQKVAAWIVKSNPFLAAKDIKAYCCENLPKHFRPQKLFFIEEMPRNISEDLLL